MSSNMAQKVLTWSNSQLNTVDAGFTFMFIFRLVHENVFESEFASGIKDVTFITLYNVCAVPWEVFSTVGGVQYRGGIS